MAEGKKSFVLYADLLHTVKKMPIEKSGELFITILKYVNDENPEVEDMVVDLVFEPIKRQLKRDLIKYEEKRKQWSEAGKKSAENKKKLKYENSTNVETVEQTSTVSTVNVTVNDTVNVTDISKEKLSAIDTFFKDYPNSSYIERVSQDLKIPVNKLVSKLPEFRTTSGSEYQNIGKFSDHFKRWCNTLIKAGKFDNTETIVQSSVPYLGKRK